MHDSIEGVLSRTLCPRSSSVSALSHFWQVHWSERYERAWAPRAWASLCVSKAMQKELARNWKVGNVFFLLACLAALNYIHPRHVIIPANFGDCCR